MGRHGQDDGAGMGHGGAGKAHADHARPHGRAHGRHGLAVFEDYGRPWARPWANHGTGWGCDGDDEGRAPCGDGVRQGIEGGYGEGGSHAL